MFPLNIKNKCILVPTLDAKNYDIDWRDKAFESKHLGYEVLVIPKGTILYSGTYIYKQEPGYSYATLDTALWYAFCSDFQRGDQGKVITLVTNKDLYILDMTKQSNYVYIRSKFRDIPTEGDMDHFEFAFRSNGKERVSNGTIDKELSIWIAKNVDLDGWGLKEMSNYGGKSKWHDELNINKPQSVLTKLGYEFTTDNKDIYLKDSKGTVIKQFKPDSKTSLFEELSRGKLFKWVCF